jgi:hypothetical protein
MAFVFHIHPAPSCEPTRSTSCASVDGSDWEHSCFQIASGRNRHPFYQFTQPSVAASLCSGNSLDFFDSFSV